MGADTHGAANLDFAVGISHLGKREYRVDVRFDAPISQHRRETLHIGIEGLSPSFRQNDMLMRQSS